MSFPSSQGEKTGGGQPAAASADNLYNTNRFVYSDTKEIQVWQKKKDGLEISPSPGPEGSVIFSCCATPLRLRGNLQSLLLNVGGGNPVVTEYPRAQLKVTTRTTTNIRASFVPPPDRQKGSSDRMPQDLWITSIYSLLSSG